MLSGAELERLSPETPESARLSSPCVVGMSTQTCCFLYNAMQCNANDLFRAVICQGFWWTQVVPFLETLAFFQHPVSVILATCR